MNTSIGRFCVDVKPNPSHAAIYYVTTAADWPMLPQYIAEHCVPLFKKPGIEAPLALMKTDGAIWLPLPGEIYIVAGGGTYDKIRDPIAEIEVFEHTHTPDVLAIARCQVPVVVEEIYMIDSLDETAWHREILLKRLQEVPYSRVVLTYGTSRMCQTARYLAERISDKTIVMTGAMVPYTVKGSDANVNLLSAVTAVQLLPRGVFVVMGGVPYAHDQVWKDDRNGRFVGTPFQSTGDCALQK